MKLSLIFKRTIKPEIINKLRPVEANNNNTGLKYRPINKPAAPNNCRNPVIFLNFGKPYRSNSKIIKSE